MALADHIKRGFPILTTDKTGDSYEYQYRGLASVLDPLKPSVFATVGGYPVQSVKRIILDDPTWIDLVVTTYAPFVMTTVEQTDDQYPFNEIDQVQIEKPLRQHPDFIGFSADDWKAVTAWDAEIDTVARAAFEYYDRDSSGEVTAGPTALTGTSSSGQVAYATLRLLGVESFLDFAPVVRKTSRYNGNIPPSSADAGQKTSAPSYAPSGYEWLKTADRVSKAGLNAGFWLRQEEWMGARKILLDKDELFT